MIFPMFLYQCQKQKQCYFYTSSSIIFMILVSWIQQQQQQHVYTNNLHVVIDTIVCEAFTITAIKNQYLYQRIERKSRCDILKLYDTTTTTSTTTTNDINNYNENITPSNDLLNYLPSTSTTNKMIVIEYCTGCKWNLRAFWMAQELLYRNNNSYKNMDTKLLSSSSSSLGVTLIPSSNPGTYKITQFNNYYNNKTTYDQQVLWDRTIDGGFPEIEELQQRILLRNNNVNDTSIQRTEQPDKNIDIESSVPNSCPNIISIYYYSSSSKDKENNIGIDTFLFRAAYVAQEIVSTFQNEIHAISLIPQSYNNTNENNNNNNIPLLTIQLNHNITIYEYDLSNSIPFIPIKELKQRIRDYINPNMNLGHSDVTFINNNSKEILAVSESSSTNNNDDNNINDDDVEAEKARQYFGVA